MSVEENPFPRIARQLGPLRCLNALRAYVDEDAKGDWTRCVLARAWGAPGELQNERRVTYKCPDERSTIVFWESPLQTAARLFSISARDVQLVTIAFDANDPLLCKALEDEADKVMASTATTKFQEALT